MTVSELHRLLTDAVEENPRMPVAIRWDKEKYVSARGREILSLRKDHSLWESGGGDSGRQHVFVIF